MMIMNIDFKVWCVEEQDGVYVGVEQILNIVDLFEGEVLIWVFYLLLNYKDVFFVFGNKGVI